jgi:hypothetical protein
MSYKQDIYVTLQCFIYYEFILFLIDKFLLYFFQIDDRVHVADHVSLDVDLEHGDDGHDGPHRRCGPQRIGERSQELTNFGFNDFVSISFGLE